MDITLKEITVRELADGYEDNQENGAKGYGSKLDIRPPYQREFIYKEAQRDAVIDTINKGFPLNVMYWAVRGDDNFEIIDGQQRTVSICRYVKGVFSVEKRYFYSLQDDEQEKILNYKLMIYQCTGTDSEKLEWFKTINIAGEKLTDQELRNAVYHGSWVTDAKRYFSKTDCPAYPVGNKYLSGSPIRQDYLETAIKWFSNGTIEEYMGTHQHESDAKKLWDYFQRVIEWTQKTFPNYRKKEMKGLRWGDFYNTYKDETYDPDALEKRVAKLMEDEDVTSKKGIYAYLLTGEEKHLNVRAFTDKQKREAYEQKKGTCARCNEHFKLEEMEADHITPWTKGGKTIAENCQMLCKDCNRRKSGE